MGSLTRKALTLFSPKAADVQAVNLFTNNWNQYNSTGPNTTGINYSGKATHDDVNKTITVAGNGFASNFCYISGLVIGSRYKFSASKSGVVANSFIQVKCLNAVSTTLSDSGAIYDPTNEVSFTVPANTAKVQLLWGTGSSYVGTSVTFSNLTLVAL